MTNVFMFLESNENIPIFDLPLGFSIRKFNLNDDEKTWCHIVTQAGEFTDEKLAQEKFRNWTNEFSEEISDRCFFLVDDKTGQDIGTVTSWEGVNEYKGLGRLHWVAIIPKYQNLGLAKPMISYALKCMKEKYSTFYLKTDNTKQKAIHLYSDFGFTQKDPINPKN